MGIPTRTLGKTGEEVTILGLGGEGILRTFGHEADAYGLINAAIDLGIRYFESARAYSGSESYYGGALRERRKEVFLTSKSHARDRKGAMVHLTETLRNMETDYLDLWQIHDVRTREEINEIFGPGGAIEAFWEAKQRGMTRFIGVTGHHDPLVTGACVELHDFDTVLIPVNPAEPHFKSFISEVIPLAGKKEMGIIGMKVYFRGLAARLPSYTSMEPFFRYALSHPLSTVVIGCDNLKQLKENVQYAMSFEPMDEAEMKRLEDSLVRLQRQMMYYKM